MKIKERKIEAPLFKKKRYLNSIYSLGLEVPLGHSLFSECILGSMLKKGTSQPFLFGVKDVKYVKYVSLYKNMVGHKV